MASPNLDTLLPLLLQDLPECPLATVRMAVIRAARRFCRESTAWRILAEPLVLVSDTRDYAITVPAGADVALITNIYRPIGELVGKTLDQLRLLLPDWQTAIGGPRYFNSQDVRKASIYPLPSPAEVGIKLVPRVALMPLRTADDLPAELVDRYEDALIAGTLALLFAGTSNPWSRPNDVATKEQCFVRLITEARIAVDFHNNARGSIHVAPREFGA